MFPREEPVPYLITETHETMRYAHPARAYSQLTLLDEAAAVGDDTPSKLNDPAGSPWQVIQVRQPDSDWDMCRLEGCKGRGGPRRFSKSAEELERFVRKKMARPSRGWTRWRRRGARTSHSNLSLNKIHIE